MMKPAEDRPRSDILAPYLWPQNSVSRKQRTAVAETRFVQSCSPRPAHQGAKMQFCNQPPTEPAQLIAATLQKIPLRYRDAPLRSALFLRSLEPFRSSRRLML